EVWVDGIKQLTGAIGEVNGVDEEGGHTVTYSGRDKTGDFIDSQIIGFDDIGGNISLKKALELILDNIGLNVGVVDLLEPELFNAAEDVIDDKDGTGSLNMAFAYGRKRQALISSNADGDICIETTKAKDSGAILQRVKNGENNIISQSWSLIDSRLFNKYIHKGQVAPRALNLAGINDVNVVENQRGTVVDNDVRAGRQKVIVEGKSYSSEQLLKRAKWSKQLAKAQATNFNCAVKDHTKYNGGLWRPNTLVVINSDAADIHRKMLIDTVVFSGGEGQPTITRLKMVEKDVYTIVEPKFKPIGALNDGFKS
ncbi:MAG: hypothetical protein KAI17_24515, partial [Thiotrichaceae bacterium]|nr:hypothetical protein [Thiotrichaceae bacterium]